jgi:hypothetical protein
MKEMKDYLHKTKGCREMQRIDAQTLTRHIPESHAQKGNRVNLTLIT